MTTDAPARASSSAIAFPIPREAPVTRAVFPSREAKVTAPWPFSLARKASGLGQALFELVERRDAVDRDGLDAAVDPLDQPGEDIARTDLDERLHAVADQ